MRRTPTIWPLLGMVLASLLFYFLALDSLVDDSPTMDEQNHLARGLALLQTGDPRLSLEHPPLINGLSALLPQVLLDIQLPLDDPSWSADFGWYEFARLTLWERNLDVTRMIFLARLPIVWLTLGLALTGFHVARRLWGRPAGYTAFLFLLFEPNLLAHGRYSTTDVGGTLFLLLATFWLWRLWQHGDRLPLSALLLAGLGLGLAFGSKLSSLSFVPIFALLALLPAANDRRWLPAAGRRLLALALAGLIALPVVWALFAFEWRPFRFQTDWLVGLNRLAGPMPTFWAGIEQIALLSEGGRPSFLLGQFSSDGFPLYFPIAYLVKTPLPILLLGLLAALLLVARPATRRRALFLLLPITLYVALSVTSGLNLGYRHLLPIVPLIILLISGLAAYPAGGWGRTAVAWPRPLLSFALLSLVASDLLIHPHYLSYFNAAAGGPANGHNILVDSNIDWGQDLLRLRDWMAAEGVEEVKLAWFGSAVPDYYGIEYEPLPGLPYHFDLWWDPPFDPAQPPPGVYAISVSNLWELPLAEKHVFPYFRARPPDDRVGYSILIYDVSPGE